MANRASVQWLNVRFTPLRYRVLIVNLIDVAWSAVVSWMTHRRRAQAVEEEGRRAAGARAS